jgi:hypothetical protein
MQQRFVSGNGQPCMVTECMRQGRGVGIDHSGLKTEDEEHRLKLTARPLVLPRWVPELGGVAAAR